MKYEAGIENSRMLTRYVEIEAQGIRAAHAAAVAQCDEAKGEFVRGVNPVENDGARHNYYIEMMTRGGLWRRVAGPYKSSSDDEALRYYRSQSYPNTPSWKLTADPTRLILLGVEHRAVIHDRRGSEEVA